jgi:hypothetical protein
MTFDGLAMANAPSLPDFLSAVSISDDYGGISRHNGIGGHLSGDHGARADNRAFSNRDSRKNDGAHANVASGFNDHALEFDILKQNGF